MVDENIKAQEIKRLTTPLTFKNSKAYDCEDNIINCTETISETRYILEPRPGILNDEEILHYAPQSKAASKIRLNMGSGNFYDILRVHESLPWFLGLYYVLLICIAIPVNHSGNHFSMLIVLLLAVLPLLYLYRVFNIKSYIKRDKQEKTKMSEEEHNVKTETVSEPKETYEEKSGKALEKYNLEAKELKATYDAKEEVVKDLIEKRFKPPQITYDRFISSINSCHELFYKQFDTVKNITELATDDTPRVVGELNSKIDAMKKIIKQIEDLTNELVINISNNDKSDDVNVLIDDMENLIESVKEY